MAALTAKSRLNTADHLRAINIDLADIKILEFVLLFVDPTWCWLWPLHVADMDGKVVKVDDDGCSVQVSIDSIKRYNFKEDGLEWFRRNNTSAFIALREDAEQNSYGINQSEDLIGTQRFGEI